MKTRHAVAGIVLGAYGVAIANAQPPSPTTDKVIAQTSTARSSAAMTNGEVLKVNRDAKTLTIKHEEIKSLHMPPMTMPFEVKDPAMLDQVKQGDKIRFRAEQVGSAAVVTHIEAAK